MNLCKIIMIIIISILGLAFLLYFVLSIKKLNQVSNVRIINVNGTKFLTWDPSGPLVNYVIGLNVGGFLSKRSTSNTRIPLYRCDIPIKSNETGISITFVNIARGGKFQPSDPVNGVIFT